MAAESKPALVAVFENRESAIQAVDALEHAGFTVNDVGFAIRGEDAVQGGMITDTLGAKDSRGAIAGIVSGSVIGGILGAAAALLVPGVGPVIAAGVLTFAMGGAAAGAAIGGIFGAMTGLGVSEHEAKFYENEFNQGRAIVAVKPGDRAARAVEILRRFGGYDMQARSQSPVPTEGIFSEP